MSSAERTTPTDFGNDELEQHSGPFRALYNHWEAHQWSPLELDLKTDAESFAALDEEERQGFIWAFAHRFHAEFNVASLLAPFLQYAPHYEMQLLIATQVADEHRHLQSVLRVYEEVFGVRGGFEGIRDAADQNRDIISDTLYGELDAKIQNLATSGSEEDYVKAVVSYHILAEGVGARTAQNLTARQYEKFGDFPGLSMGQRLVARDEARHIGIGVTYIRQMLAQKAETRGWVDAILDEFAIVAASALETALDTDMHDQAIAGYGVEPAGFYEEAIRLLQIRMRSVGYLDD